MGHSGFYQAAEVVKEMFRLALAGHSTVQITKILTAKGVLTPSAHKVRNGDLRFIRQLENNGESNWCNATVQTILRNMVYRGDMENRKTETLNYKSKERVTVPKSERIVVQNTHEPLVSREDWKRVQELIKTRQRPKKYSFVNVFKSIVFCSECGHRLTLGFRYNRKRQRTFPYEDNACGNLDAESYRKFLSDYQAEQKQLSERLQAIEAELSQSDEYGENLQKLGEAVQGYMDVKELSVNMLNQLVERIEVGHVVEVDGQKQQEINIIYRFIGTEL